MGIGSRIGLSAAFALLLLVGLWGLSSAVRAHADPIAVGLVTDGPTAYDRSFNQASYEGLLRGQAKLGVVGTVYTSTSAADYSSNLQRCVDDGNTICISVGFLMADATISKAATYTGVKFAIVDFTWNAYPPNLRGITFASDETGYLAGVLAAGMTQSNVVGAIGGMRIPSVDAFIRGYRNGAICTDPAVQVKTSYVGSFVDPAGGSLAAQAMLDQGADVIFPVAGPTGNGALLTTTGAGKWGIGVDVDEYLTLFEDGSVAGADKLLSSALKRVDNAVFDTIADIADGTFTAGTTSYGLAADGVGLAPYHEAEPDVPQSVRDALETARQGIISGALDVNTPCGKAVGLVVDEGTLDDNWFNGLSYQGLLRAEAELGVTGTVYTSASTADYEPNLLQCVDDGNALCLSVGFRLVDATAAVAAGNPGTRFAIADVIYDSYPANLRGMAFASDEVGYLAGTLAGLMTQSDIVGTIGGMPIPSVDLFITGYRNGARHANPGVTVLTSYTNDFANPDLGSQAAQAMMAQGADVIFAVAGRAGDGALLTATQAGTWSIGVDTDQYLTLFENGAVAGADKLLSSAMKRLDNAVFDTIDDAISGAFTSGTVLYDLEAEGVGLAPYHAAAPAVSPGVQDEVERVRQAIMSGAIDVDSPYQFKVFLPMVEFIRRLP